MPTTRADFQRLAVMRIEEAEILLNAGRWDGAYYLAGYAVECALKACIIRMLMASDTYPDRKFSDNCYKHELTLLLRLAGLEDEMNRSGRVAARWAAVKDWSEQRRYERGVAEKDAKDFYNAIADTSEGVLQWLRARW